MKKKQKKKLSTESNKEKETEKDKEMALLQTEMKGKAWRLLPNLPLLFPLYGVLGYF